MFDTVLAIIQSSLVAIASWAGYKVTITPLKKSEGAKAARYTLFFKLVLSMSVLVGGFQAFRGTHASGEILTYLGRIESTAARSQHTFVQIEDPVPIINDPYVPFRVGEHPNVGIQIFDAGNAPLKRGFFGEALVLLPEEVLGEDEIQSRVFHEFTSRTPVSHLGAVAPHKQEGQYLSVATEQPLTRDQVNRLENNSLRLCALARVGWEDETGQYCTTSFRCLEKDIGKNLVAYNWRGVGHLYNQESPCKFQLVEIPH